MGSSTDSPFIVFVIVTTPFEGVILLSAKVLSVISNSPIIALVSTLSSSVTVLPSTIRASSVEFSALENRALKAFKEPVAIMLP